MPAANPDMPAPMMIVSYMGVLRYLLPEAAMSRYPIPLTFQTDRVSSILETGMVSPVEL